MFVVFLTFLLACLAYTGLQLADASNKRHVAACAAMGMKPDSLTGASVCVDKDGRVFRPQIYKDQQ